MCQLRILFQLKERWSLWMLIWHLTPSSINKWIDGHQDILRWLEAKKSWSNALHWQNSEDLLRLPTAQVNMLKRFLNSRDRWIFKLLHLYWYFLLVSTSTATLDTNLVPVEKFPLNEGSHRQLIGPCLLHWTFAEVSCTTAQPSTDDESLAQKFLAATKKEWKIPRLGVH